MQGFDAQLQEMDNQGMCFQSSLDHMPLIILFCFVQDCLRFNLPST